MKYLSENDRYKAIYDLVLNVCNLSEFPEEYSGSESNRWFDIVFVCDEYSGYDDCELFYAAIHKIRWGQYPELNYSDKFKELLDLVVNEILRDGEAFASWVHHDSFHVILADAEGQDRANCSNGPCCFTHEHREYLNGRMFNAVLYSKNSIAEFRDIDEDELCSHKCYEGVISRLLPETASWDSSKWIDERNILDAMFRQYGVRFADDAMSYNKLIGRLSDLWFPCNAETVFPVENSLDIAVLSVDLAKLIWPEVTEETLADCFLSIYKNVKKYGSTHGKHPMYPSLFSNESCDGEILKKSWLAKLVAGWIASGKRHGTDPDAVKKASFNLAVSW